MTTKILMKACADTMRAHVAVLDSLAARTEAEELEFMEGEQSKFFAELKAIDDEITAALNSATTRFNNLRQTVAPV